MKIMNKKRCIIINTWLKKVFGWCIVIELVCMGYLLLPTEMSWIEHEDLQNVLKTIENFKSNNVPVDKIIKISMAMLLIIIIMTVVTDYLLKHRYIGKKLQLVQHTSLNEMNFNIDESVEDVYDIEPVEINVVSQMKNNDILFAVKEQDKKVEEIKNQIRANIGKKKEYAYCGIAHTPLIYRMGYQFGDETRFELFHKIRTGSIFKTLQTNGRKYTIAIQQEKNAVESNKLLVVISTTSEIKDNDLREFNLNNLNIVRFRSEEFGYESVDNRDKVDGYAYSIMKRVEDKVKEWNISEVHMVIASSVALTFALGQATRENSVPNLKVYNYKDGSYPWGIKIYKLADKCLN